MKKIPRITGDFYFHALLTRAKEAGFSSVKASSRLTQSEKIKPPSSRINNCPPDGTRLNQNANHPDLRDLYIPR